MECYVAALKHSGFFSPQVVQVIPLPTVMLKLDPRVIIRRWGEG